MLLYRAIQKVCRKIWVVIGDMYWYNFYPKHLFLFRPSNGDRGKKFLLKTNKEINLLERHPEQRLAKSKIFNPNPTRKKCLIPETRT